MFISFCVTKKLYNVIMETFDYQIIANLLAGKGLASKKLEELKNFLDGHRLTYRVLEIVKPTPISLIPPDGKTHISKGVICVGGDGTVSETLGYMTKRNINLPIFIIPTGTANFLADNIGVKGDISYDKIMLGIIKKYDLGVYEDKEKRDFFLIGIGFGFEQKFLELAKQHQKKFLGKLSYFLAAFTELFRLKPVFYQLVIDEKKLNIASTMLSVLNLKPKISPFLPLFPETDINQVDGLLDILYVEHRNFILSFLGILFFHLLGRVDFGLVKRFMAKKIEISSSEKIKSQIDGEIKGELPFKVSVIPEGVKFLV